MTMPVPQKQEILEDGGVRGVPTIVAVLAIGLVAGFLASLVVGGEGLLRYLFTGVLGALVGGYVLNALNLRLPIANPTLQRIATATIGAIIVVLIARIIA
jgi:uncharacterized membrane protein YeaQ/YmgE (transglycosylase-associated protein family)